MKDFKKRGFKSGFKGGPRRDASGPVELYQATCAHCKKLCEVPFRPNGKKPVFCRDCFNKGEAGASSNTRTRTRPNTDTTSRTQSKLAMSPQHEQNFKHQLTEINAKIDTLTALVKALQQ